MRLAEFIKSNLPEIVSDWEEFARTLLPNATVKVLRDHAEQMLRAIAEDMDAPQTEQQRTNKSHGLLTRLPPAAESAAQQHGTGRQAEGLTVGDMIAEFRARRNLAEAQRDLAAVLERWQRKYPKFTDWVKENIGSTLTFYRLPRLHDKHLKSTNMLERLNEEIRRRKV